MITDRELLEGAAKAAGLKINANMQAQRDKLIDPATAALWINTDSTAWNPLIDDDHALRLAVKLELEISVSYDAGENVYVGYVAAGDDMKYVIEQKGSDPYAATRRAIVRAAYEIGRAKP